MHTGFLDMLHDARDMHVVAIADRVHIHLDGVRQVAVNEQRRIAGDFQRLRGELAQVVVIARDFHGAPAEHKGRAQHDRIADLVGFDLRFLDTARRARRRLLYVQLVEQACELFAVFGAVDGGGRRAKDRHLLVKQRPGQLQRRLPAKLDDQSKELSIELLLVDDLQHMLDGQRFEIQAIRRIIVCGHRFRVAVDHD